MLVLEILCRKMQEVLRDIHPFCDKAHEIQKILRPSKAIVKNQEVEYQQRRETTIPHTK